MLEDRLREQSEEMERVRSESQTARGEATRLRAECSRIRELSDTRAKALDKLRRGKDVYEQAKKDKEELQELRRFQARVTRRLARFDVLTAEVKLLRRFKERALARTKELEELRALRRRMRRAAQ